MELAMQMMQRKVTEEGNAVNGEGEEAHTSRYKNVGKGELTLQLNCTLM
jgi:hypothetical protein